MLKKEFQLNENALLSPNTHKEEAFIFGHRLQTKGIVAIYLVFISLSLNLIKVSFILHQNLDENFPVFLMTYNIFRVDI